MGLTGLRTFFSVIVVALLWSGVSQAGYATVAGRRENVSGFSKATIELLEQTSDAEQTGYKECRISFGQETRSKGWHARPPLLTGGKSYYAASREACEALAQFFQKGQSPTIQIYLTANQAGPSGAGLTTLTTFTKWRFNDSFLSDSSGKIVSAPASPALAHAAVDLDPAPGSRPRGGHVTHPGN